MNDLYIENHQNPSCFKAADNKIAVCMLKKKALSSAEGNANRVIVSLFTYISMYSKIRQF